ncbi:MAG TPA: hypothetical protein VGX28_07660 [Frankiaceae bacterium]|jgi:hypothetical protein|nr:hypothetical protein [Frankiaceae bacterium]
MRRLAAALVLAAALPVPAADAGLPPLRAYVLERVSADATDPAVRGGTWAGDGQYAYAAVASATAGADGRFDDAEGAMFFGVSATSDPSVSTPAGRVQCSAVPAAGTACVDGMAGGGIAFLVWWEDATFDRVVVAMRGHDQRVELDDHVRGWRLSAWRGPVREVAGDLATATATPYGAGSFVDAESVGGPGGSVAIGHPPCTQVGYVSGGAGAVRLLGGTREVVGSCPATFSPPAAAAPGSTEWSLTGAAGGVSDVPVRMVVIESPVRR